MEQKTSTPAEQEAITRAGGSSLMRMLLAGGFVAAIIGVECAIAYYVFPTAEDVAKLAQAQQAVKGDLPEPATEPADERLLDVKQRQEISLGEFAVTAYQPTTNTTLRIDFQLYGTVLVENADPLMKLLDDNKHRYREQILVIMRGAEMTDLTDAGLGLIKRKILEKTNRVLGRALLEEIIFSDFSFVEQ